MAFTTEDRNDVIALAVAVWDAAPGASNLSELAVQFNNGATMLQITEGLTQSEIFTNEYPAFLTNEEFATEFVGNVLNGKVSAEDQQWAVDQLTAQLNGGMSQAEVILGAIDALQAVPEDDANWGAAAATFNNKVEVATYFSVELEKDGETVADLQAVLDGVDETEESVTAAKAEADDASSVPGTTFNMTPGADEFTGGAGNDTINARTINASGDAANTLTAFDEINGGGGQDTMNIYSDGTNNTSMPSSATVQGVEVVNIYNDTAAFETDTTNSTVQANKFQGATQVWQINLSTDVVSLGESTTAGFRNVQNGTLNVTASGASATVALDNVSDDGDATNGNTVALNIDGDSVNTVAVAGDIAGVSTGQTKTFNLNVTGGEDEQTLTISSAADATLDITNNGDAVTTIDASGSAGDITYDGTPDTDVASITGGAGDDTLTLGTTFSTTVTSASVVGGDGDDTITVTPTNSGTIEVDAGAGDDTVVISNIGNLSTDSSVDGGAGEDTLETSTSGTLDAESYTLLNNLFSNFEGLTFSAAVTVDASRLSDYKSFTFESASTVTDVADDQALTAEANLDATADGYSSATTPNTYAGTLDISSTDGDPTVTAQAEAVNLNVGAGAAAVFGGTGSNSVTLAGDVQEAVVTVNNFSSPLSTAAFSAADVTVDNTTAGTLDALATLTLSGSGAATVTNADGNDLVTVDASGLDTVDADGDAVTGLTYTTSNTEAEMVSVGAGLDALTINAGASTVADMDTITGFEIAVDSNGDYAGDANSDDLTFNGTAATLTSLGDIDANSLDLALVDVAAQAGTDAVIFDYDGDSYVYFDDDANAEVNDADSLVKLTGGVDHDLAIDGAITTAA